VNTISVHIPVLLNEAISLLNPERGNIIIDCTLGGGGHSKEIIKRIIPEGKLISLDRDSEAIEKFKEFAEKYPLNMEMINDNFEHMDKIINKLGLREVDGILMDLGISSDQLKDEKRGFSFQKDGPLDMRMDKNCRYRAEDVVNNFSEEELSKIIYTYGEETNSRKIAREIINERTKKKFKSTMELANLIKKVNKPSRKSDIHPATKTFMALRIFINRELEVLENGLTAGFNILKPGGKIVVISFHSLEDRIVKRFFTEKAKTCRCPKDFPICKCEGKALGKPMNKKLIYPTEEEKKVNVCSRSARLRALEKI